MTFLSFQRNKMINEYMLSKVFIEHILINCYSLLSMFFSLKKGFKVGVIALQCRTKEHEYMLNAVFIEY